MRWKEIKGFKGYSISDTGLVKNRFGKVLQPYDNGNGYLKVSLCKDGKVHRIYIHRLVGLHFVDGFEKGLTIDHIDANRKNNHYTNLQWVTLQRNIELKSIRKKIS